MIQKYTPDFSTESKIEADMDKAELMIHNALKELLRGQSMSLISDSATFKYYSVIVVLASCSKIDTPVVLSIITLEEKSSNEDDDTYNFELAAADIKLSAESMGIDISSQVTCSMGDNVNHNVAIARELGVPQGKCLPHALNLIVKHRYNQIPMPKELLLDVGSIMSAGGTSERKDELKSIGLNPNCMSLHESLC
jgi:hypothetical protein